MVQMRDFAARRAGAAFRRSAATRGGSGAFVFSPSVYCSTEPLSNSMPSCAPICVSSCAKLQHRLGITSVYVTHDLEEALAMSDRIVVMRDGWSSRPARRTNIYNLPQSAFVADFVGSVKNLFFLKNHGRPS